MKDMNFRRRHPLTVMFLIDQLDKMGGAERSLYLLAEGFEKRGHRVIVCSLKGGELSEKMHQDGFHLENLNVNKIYNYSGLKAIFRMVRIVHREKISVILSYHASSDFIGILVAFLARIPIVTTRRDMGFMLKPRHIWLYRFINRFFDRIATVSSAVKEVVVQTQWAKRSDIVVIHNGVVSFSTSAKVLSPFERLNSIDLNDGYLKICCLANIRPIKGHNYLIDAASLVVKRFPNVCFLLVGDYDINDPYFNELQRQIKTLRLQSTVKITGELPRQDVPALMAAMDISALPSSSEGMSNTLLESMSAGKPVVATAVGGNPELVEDGKTGYLVPPRDSHSMAEALLKLLANPELRHDMGLRGRSLVERKFSVTRMAERYEDLLEFVYLKRKLGKWQGLRSRIMETMEQARSWTKILIASMLYHSGSVAALRLLKRAFHRGRVKILCFHDVSELARGRSLFSVFISPDAFVRFLNFLVQKYKVVSLEEAIHLLRTGKSLKEDFFALTFDDCYKGWINHVSPECRRFGLPYTIFVATDPLDSGRPLLYDALVFLAENTWRKVADLSRWQLGMFLLDNPENIFHFVEKVHEFLRCKNREDRKQYIQTLSDYLRIPLNSEKCQSTLLNWDDVREMDKYGTTIGAHSVNHTCLRDVGEAQCSLEIYQSKRRLEEELGHSINYFAYPYGAPHDYTRTTIKIVAEAGFRNAFTLEADNSSGFRPFEIGRRAVSRGMFAGPDGDFHESLLATELCGLGDLFFGRVFMQRMRHGTPTNY
jgi:glycosyltransferase involved in cell wall biosynthesis/peptidoglycan/xylan/chitin deacetylase (PgdA/CDA1 family)